MDRNTRLGILPLTLRAARRSGNEHLHHLACLLQEGAGIPTGYRFHHPYSSRSNDLDDNIDRLSYYGFTRSKYREIIGWDITPILIYDLEMRQFEQQWTIPATPYREIIEMVTAEFPNTQEPEARTAANILWMKRPSRDENIALVQRAMPRMDREKIETQYDRLHRLGWMPGAPIQEEQE